MEIIDNNPYRILGVYANSPLRERVANACKARAFLKVGRRFEPDVDFSQVLPPIERTEEEISQAEAAIALEKDQLRYAMFWFVNQSQFDDSAFSCLNKGDLTGAEDVWRKAKCESVVETVSVLQNLIVCALVKSDYDIALELATKLYCNVANKQQFVASIVGNGSDLSGPEVDYTFLDMLSDSVGVSRIKPFIMNRDWMDHVVERATDPAVHGIDAVIDVAKKSKGVACLEAANKMIDDVVPYFNDLLSLVDASDIRYQSVADKLIATILLCAAEYKEKSLEFDAARNVVALLERGKLFTGSQKANELYSAYLKKVLVECFLLPPESVAEECRAVYRELRVFQSKACDFLTCELSMEKVRGLLSVAETSLRTIQPCLKTISHVCDQYDKIFEKVVDEVFGTIMLNGRLKDFLMKCDKTEANEIKKELKLIYGLISDKWPNVWENENYLEFKRLVKGDYNDAPLIWACVSVMIVVIILALIVNASL